MNSLLQPSYKSRTTRSNDICRVVQVRPLNPDQYLHEKIYVIKDQIVDRNNYLRDIDKAHCRALV